MKKRLTFDYAQDHFGIMRDHLRKVTGAIFFWLVAEHTGRLQPFFPNNHASLAPMIGVC